MAVPSAGTFTAAALQKVQVLQDRVWKDNIGNARYMSHVDSLLAIQKEGTASGAFRELQTEKDKTVRLVWLNDCDDTTAACSNDCTIGGAELSADAKDYALNICRTTGFTIKEKATRSTEFDREMHVAQGMLNHIRLLDEYLNGQVLAAIETNRGANEYFPTGWSETSSDTVVPDTDFSRRMIPRLIQTGVRNRFNNPYILSGENLWYEKWDAMMDAGNLDGKGNAAAFGALRIYHDLFNLDAANDPDFKTYLISQGALAFVSKAYYNTPVDYFTNTRYSVPSNSIPGVRYDVVYTNTCTSNEMLHHFSLYANAGIFLNPTGCSETRTGIISFLKDPAT